MFFQSSSFVHVISELWIENNLILVQSYKSSNKYYCYFLGKKESRISNEKLIELFWCWLQNFELTKHRLIYEGALTWRTKGQKNVDLHVVLLEEYILLLQKQDDKYVLKFHSINFLNSKEESKFTHSPIIKIATVLVRPVATGTSPFQIK